MGIAVLGPLTVDGGLHLGRRDRVVLTVLAVHPGDAVSADILADVLWGVRVPASCTKIVQGCMVRLRKALGNRSIETSSRGYRLAIPRLFAALFLLSVTGIVIYLVLDFISRRLLRHWHESAAAGEAE